MNVPESCSDTRQQKPRLPSRTVRRLSEKLPCFYLISSTHFTRFKKIDSNIIIDFFVFVNGFFEILFGFFMRSAARVTSDKCVNIIIAHHPEPAHLILLCISVCSTKISSGKSLEGIVIGCTRKQPLCRRTDRSIRIPFPEGDEGRRCCCDPGTFSR